MDAGGVGAAGGGANFDGEDDDDTGADGGTGAVAVACCPDGPARLSPVEPDADAGAGSGAAPFSARAGVGAAPTVESVSNLSGATCLSIGCGEVDARSLPCADFAAEAGSTCAEHSAEDAC